MNYLKIQSPLSKAKNLGASGSGVHHWWHQRLTSIMMALLLPWICCFAYTTSGQEVSIVLEHLRLPYNIIPMLLFVTTAFYHACLGMRVVIEDYIPNLCVRYSLIIAIQLFSMITVISAALALLSLMTL